VQRLKNVKGSLIIQESDVCRKMTRLGKRAGTILGILFLLLVTSHFSSILVSASTPITSESLTLKTYLDGFVLVNYKLELNQTYPAINVSLLGEAYEEVLVVDEQNLPLDYSIVNSEATIYSLNASQIIISYFTPDLTSKTGKYWTFRTETRTNATVILPETVSIISINNLPELIESSNGQVVLVMPSGTIEITYIAEHDFDAQTQSYEPWPLIVIAILSTSFSIIASVLWLLKRKKLPKLTELKDEVDVNKLFERHKNLRQEEVQVISFLAERHGTAFEAELFGTLNLPRTTTWRLLKRLQKMGIVDITKSRRQNIVSIKKKYLKK
jgi:uncharacterized membrane protein